VLAALVAWRTRDVGRTQAVGTVARVGRQHL
jgi:hypothetical protein